MEVAVAINTSFTKLLCILWKQGVYFSPMQVQFNSVDAHEINTKQSSAFYSFMLYKATLLHLEEVEWSVVWMIMSIFRRIIKMPVVAACHHWYFHRDQPTLWNIVQSPCHT